MSVCIRVGSWPIVGVVRYILSSVLLLVGCRGVDLSPSDLPSPGGEVSVVRPSAVVPDGGTDAGSVLPQPSVSFVAPMDGARFVQDVLLASEWAAEVSFEVAHMDVDRVELTSGGVSLGDVVDGRLTFAFFGEGEHVVDAVGYGGGVELARDSITILVDAPVDTSCHGMLDALGLDWAPAAATLGIDDPVRVQPIINGVAFRYVSNSEPTAMLMDCSLGIRLARLAQAVIPYGIDEIIHIGIYNYRCIGGGDPSTGCTPSQHAYATAIDLHAFGLAGSTETYSTEDDFVITTRGDACPIPSFNEKDRILKELACTMWAERIFNIVLTPNYNSDHRNHYHVDLTAGSMYLGSGVEGVDPAIEGLGH